MLFHNFNHFTAYFFIILVILLHVSHNFSLHSSVEFAVNLKSNFVYYREIDLLMWNFLSITFEICDFTELMLHCPFYLKFFYNFSYFIPYFINSVCIRSGKLQNSLPHFGIKGIEKELHYPGVFFNLKPAGL